jgi:hypothetical protein
LKEEFRQVEEDIEDHANPLASDDDSSLKENTETNQTPAAPPIKPLKESDKEPG